MIEEVRLPPTPWLPRSQLMNTFSTSLLLGVVATPHVLPNAQPTD